MHVLYRGVSLKTWLFRKALTPKMAGAFEYGGTWDEPGDVWDDGGTWDTSPQNAVIRHQVLQLGLPTSGISTTPHRERAIWYALLGGKRYFGHLLELHVLPTDPIDVHRVKDIVTWPAIPEDDEHVLVLRPLGGKLPASIVAKATMVTRAALLP